MQFSVGSSNTVLTWERLRKIGKKTKERGGEKEEEKGKKRKTKVAAELNSILEYWNSNYIYRITASDRYLHW